jgi:hypothetical protein
MIPIDLGLAAGSKQVWIAEMCLWTPWLHMGNLEAQEPS